MHVSLHYLVLLEVIYQLFRCDGNLTFHEHSFVDSFKLLPQVAHTHLLDHDKHMCLQNFGV